MKCKNCEHDFEGNFCSRCGQNAEVHRFNFIYFLKETFFSSLDIEKGFFRTVKVLFIRPGSAIREYLNGRRLSLYVPGKFLLLFGAISTFIAIRYELFLSEDVGEMYSSKEFLPRLEEFLNFAEHYATVINIITVPVFALCSYLIFKKQKYNYTEHLILNIYITAQQLVMLIVLSPVIIFLPNSVQEVISIYTILTLAYNYWVFAGFFRAKSWQTGLKVIVAILLAYVAQFFVNYYLYLMLKTLLPNVML